MAKCLTILARWRVLLSALEARPRSKWEMVEALEEAGLEASLRTIERDMYDLQEETGIRIAYNRHRNYYELDVPEYDLTEITELSECIRRIIEKFGKRPTEKPQMHHA